MKPSDAMAGKSSWWCSRDATWGAPASKPNVCGRDRGQGSLHSRAKGLRHPEPGSGVVLSDRAPHPELLIKMADKALYCAKHRGRNQAASATASEQDEVVFPAGCDATHDTPTILSDLEEFRLQP